MCGGRQTDESETSLVSMACERRPVGRRDRQTHGETGFCGNHRHVFGSRCVCYAWRGSLSDVDGSKNLPLADHVGSTYFFCFGVINYVWSVLLSLSLSLRHLCDQE